MPNEDQNHRKIDPRWPLDPKRVPRVQTYGFLMDFGCILGTTWNPFWLRNLTKTHKNTSRKYIRKLMLEKGRKLMATWPKTTPKCIAKWMIKVWKICTSKIYIFSKSISIKRKSFFGKIKRSEIHHKLIQNRGQIDGRWNDSKIMEKSTENGPKWDPQLVLLRPKMNLERHPENGPKIDHRQINLPPPPDTPLGDS